MESGPKTMLIALMIPLILCCGGGYFLLSGAVDAKSKHAKEFGDRVVQRVTSKPGWDAVALRSFGNAQYQKQYSAKELGDTLIDGPAKTLGTFKSGTGRVKISSAGDAKAGQGTVIEYENKAEFTQGKALVKVEMVQEPDKSWALTSFSIAPLAAD